MTGTLDADRGIMRFLACALLVTACTAVGPRSLPTARLGSAEAAVTAAARGGADRDPRAAKHLRLAQSQIARARALIRHGEYDEAESLLSRASADAEVAAALSREAQQRADADVARMRLASSPTSTAPR